MDAFVLKQRREQLMRAHILEVQRLVEEFNGRLTEIDAQIEKAEAQDRDPLVLVRGTYGATRTVYHWAEHPCGKVQFNGGKTGLTFERMRESEAIAMSKGALKRCRSCWSY